MTDYRFHGLGNSTRTTDPVLLIGVGKARKVVGIPLTEAELLDVIDQAVKLLRQLAVTA